MYDPLKVAEAVRPKVTRIVNGVEERKYYRFRGGRWYGGIASADVIGCNMDCKFCWAWRFKNNYSLGEFLPPSKAYERLRRIAVKGGYGMMRLTGGEPTLSRRHLLDLISLAEKDGYLFIVETNGILIGDDPTYAMDLARHRNVFVRVSFKGVSEEEFVKLTGAVPEAFNLQFRALQNLVSAGLMPGRQVMAAAMISFSSDRDIAEFLMRLSDIDPGLVDNVDWEVVIMYPHVRKLLEKYGLKPRRFVNP